MLDKRSNFLSLFLWGNVVLILKNFFEEYLNIMSYILLLPEIMTLQTNPSKTRVNV